MRYPDCDAEISQILASVEFPSQATTPGEAACSAVELDAQFWQAFGDRGYRRLREPNTITKPNSDAVIRGAVREISLSKAKLLVQVRCGTYADAFCELATFEYFFSQDRCAAGVEIVPSHRLQCLISAD